MLQLRLNTLLTANPFLWKFSTALFSQAALRISSRLSSRTISTSPSMRKPTEPILATPMLFFRFLLTESSTIPKLLKDFSLTCFHGMRFSMSRQEQLERITATLTQFPLSTMTRQRLIRLSLKNFLKILTRSSPQSSRQLRNSFPRVLSAISRWKAQPLRIWLKTSLLASSRTALTKRPEK